jgi:DNA-binding transcriptional LysR family regulator
VDLVEEGFDLGVRIGAPGSDNIVARSLGETRLVPCASPAYLAAHGAPRKPEELARHDCFTYEYVSPRNLWRFRDAAGAEHSVRVAGSLHSNNGDLLAEAAAQGAGIVFEPAFIVGPDVRAGRLVPLLQEFAAPPMPIYAVYPSRKHLSAKVRVFVEFLVERFAGAQDWSAP